MHNLTISIQNQKPGLGTSYVWPGNGVGLFYIPGPTRPNYQASPKLIGCWLINLEQFAIRAQEYVTDICTVH